LRAGSEKYGYIPSFYAAQSYDLVRFIDHAIRVAGGISDRDALRDAMRLGGYPSTRGNLRFNNNHFPIQNFYLRKAVKDSDGSFTTKITDTVFTDYGDNYAKDCRMRW
jgi:branched-chain amino acid transport system substrate-binding protein